MISIKKTNISNILLYNTDVLFACLIVSIVVLLIIPIPTFIIDIFICTNIFLALLLLIIAIYLPNTLSLSSFPTILLLTTLLRLGLNVATSRLILLQADGGEVILAFGNSVIGGNLVVGIVIFLLLMIINMVVVAKGSERVAEVAARFNLDAMPGKQMSIDADLRSGILELEQAKQKRHYLNRESQFFGAMDGAMKFVKGDVIAGIIIFFINIIAGVIIGKMQFSMSISEALQTFSILSVGDGLVSIIPSLLMSICAGLIVTRIESSIEQKSIALEIKEQLTAYPKAFLITGIFTIFIGLMPGLPTIPFIILGSLGIFYSFIASKNNQQEKNITNNLDKIEEYQENVPINQEESNLPCPISIEVSKELVSLVNNETDFISRLIPMLRESLYVELGIKFPGIRIKECLDSKIPNYGYIIALNDIPIDLQTIMPDEYLVNCKSYELTSLGAIDVKSAFNYLTNTNCCTIKAHYKDLLVSASLEFYDAPMRILLHLSYILKKNTKQFITLEETQVILDQLEKSYPALVREVVPKVISLFQLSDIFRKLLHESISIKDTKTILQCLAEYGNSINDTAILTEHVRQSLARYICYNYSHYHNTLLVLLLSTQIEEIIEAGIKEHDGSYFLLLEPNIRKQILERIKLQLKSIISTAKKPVVLVSPQIRRFVRKIVEDEIFDLHIMSFQELIPGLNIQPMGTICLETEDDNYQELSIN